MKKTFFRGKAELHGEARLDTLFGVLLDGDGDYVSFEPEAASSYSNRFDYAAQVTPTPLHVLDRISPVFPRFFPFFARHGRPNSSKQRSTVANSGCSDLWQGTFGVSLWFTRRDCAIPGRYEALYSHSQVDSCSSSPEECWTDPANSNIHVLIGCAANGGKNSPI